MHTHHTMKERAADATTTRPRPDETPLARSPLRRAPLTTEQIDQLNLWMLANLRLDTDIEKHLKDVCYRTVCRARKGETLERKTIYKITEFLKQQEAKRAKKRKP